MTEVKIYTITSDDLSPPIQGEGFCTDMVRHSDYAALEAERDQLAAENAQMLRLLTDISENHDEYVNQDDYLYAGVPMDYVSEINAYVSRDVNAENPFKATDAWQREQMAKGVEAFAGSLKSAGFHHHPYSAVAIDFATKLRNGEAV